jgi:formylglycine-generating enzyme required for sulfatase activity
MRQTAIMLTPSLDANCLHLALSGRTPAVRVPAALGRKPDEVPRPTLGLFMTHNGHYCAVRSLQKFGVIPRCTAWRRQRFGIGAMRREKGTLLHHGLRNRRVAGVPSASAGGGVLNWTFIGLAVLAIALLVAQMAQAEDKLAGESFRDRLSDGQACLDCPEMVVIPAGSFILGSPSDEEGRSYLNAEPQRKVTIGRPFAIGKFEVTFGEWDACIAASRCHRRPNDWGWGRGKQPVIGVSWDEITEQYLPWLSRKTGKAYRLPSEAEWEYAARAGSTTPFWWGSSISTDQANYNGNFTYGGGPKGEYRQKPMPVDSFAPNLWGLYNVHGNVGEWVQDCWSDIGALSDGSASLTGACNWRVNRGGSFDNTPSYLRSGGRWVLSAGLSSPSLGFRLARTLNQ